jgi:hypothetical protein
MCYALWQEFEVMGTGAGREEVDEEEKTGGEAWMCWAVR